MFSAYEIFRFWEKKVEKLIIKRNFAMCLVLMIYLDFAKKKVEKFIIIRNFAINMDFAEKIGKIDYT